MPHEIPQLPGMNEHNSYNPFAHEQPRPVGLHYGDTEIHDPNDAATTPQESNSEPWRIGDDRSTLKLVYDTLREQGVEVDPLLTEKQQSYASRLLSDLSGLAIANTSEADLPPSAIQDEQAKKCITTILRKAPPDVVLPEGLREEYTRNLWKPGTVRPALSEAAEILQRSKEEIGIELDDLLTPNQRQYAAMLLDSSKSYKDISEYFGVEVTSVSQMGSRIMDSIRSQLIKQGHKELADQLPQPEGNPMRAMRPDETTAAGMTVKWVQERGADLGKIAEALDIHRTTLHRFLTKQSYFKSPVMMRAILRELEVPDEESEDIFRQYLTEYRASDSYLRRRGTQKK